MRVTELSVGRKEPTIHSRPPCCASAIRVSALSLCIAIVAELPQSSKIRDGKATAALGERSPAWAICFKDAEGNPCSSFTSRQYSDRGLARLFRDVAPRRRAP